MYIAQYLSRAGVCSRRKAIEHIKDGDVKVNGVVVDEFYKVQNKDFVKFNGKPVAFKEYVYILLNKPRGYITSRKDEQHRRTVYDLLPKKYHNQVFPVGRLDFNTTGLLLLSNDGDLAQKLIHPSHKIQKRYQAKLSKVLKPEDLLKIKNGLKLEDGFVKVDSISYFRKKQDEATVSLHIGKRRIVRRLFEELGYFVTHLDRFEFGSLTKKRLKVGEWRLLADEEVAAL